MPTETTPLRTLAAATQRVFVALWPDAVTADRLAAVAREAVDHFGGQASRQETLHMTLAFLGAVPVSRMAALEAALSGISATPFALALDRLGHWPHNRLLWAGCGQMPHGLALLAGRLESALLTAGFSPAGAGRPFVPHVTLVRRVPGKMPLAVPAIETIAWAAGNFALAVSETGAEGPSYRIVRRFPLGGC